jgi:hypothetical protein
MLQAPITDRKTKPEASSKTAEHLSEQEQPNHLSGWMGRSRQTHPMQQRENLTAMQNAYGNQAVLRMQRSPSMNPIQGGILQRKCVCGNAASTAGTCAECQQKQGRLLQRKPVGIEPSIEMPEIVHEVLSSSGTPLNLETRTFMEDRFNHDFKQVRIHTDSKASESARAVNALAYTVGHNIVFDSNQYDPNTSNGKRLLAHELTHVVQQGVTKQQISRLSFDDPMSELEQEAHRVSNAILGAESIQIKSNSTPLVQRFLSTEPAGGCGICYGLPLFAGRAAHTLIQTEFEILYPLGLVELPISSPLDENGRLDLAVATPTGFEIGEIKPANENGYADGITQIATYVAMLSALFPRSTIRPLTRLIPPIIFPTLSPTCPVQTLYVNPPVGGVYGYYCQPSFSKMRGNCPCTFDRTPVRERVPERERTRQKERQLSRTEAISLIVAFVKTLIESNVADIDRAVTNFVHENPAIAAFIITAGVAAIIALIADDLSLVGILDDVAIPPIVIALWRVATSL